LARCPFLSKSKIQLPQVSVTSILQTILIHPKTTAMKLLPAAFLFFDFQRLHSKK